MTKMRYDSQYSDKLEAKEARMVRLNLFGKQNSKVLVKQRGFVVNVPDNLKLAS